MAVDITRIVRVMRKISEEAPTYDSLSPEEKEMADYLLQGGFALIDDEGRLRPTVMGAKLVAFGEMLPMMRKDILKNTAIEIATEILKEIEDDNYSVVMSRLAELYTVLDTLRRMQG